MELFSGKQRLDIAVVGRNLDDLLPLLRELPCRIVTEKPDLVISHGGDGALLGAELQYPGVPKCAIRDKKNNPKCPRHSERETLNALFAGKLRKTQLQILRVTDAKGESLDAINDITIERSQITSAIRYRIFLGGELLRDQVVADALLISTIFGSTGYFQSITHGTFMTGIGLAYSNATDLRSFQLIPEDSRLTVQLLRGPARIVADNNPRILDADSGDELDIQILPQKTVLYGLDIFRCPDCYDLRKHGIL